MLKGIPKEGHLARAYFELAQRGAPATGKKTPWPYKPENVEELFCLTADMSRYDPRLFSILVSFLAAQWSQLNPLKVRQYYTRMKSPQTVAVMTEFLLKQPADHEEASYLFEYLKVGLKPVSLQYFYHHLYLPGSDLAARAMEGSLEEYKRWGFLAREAPVLDMKTRRPIGTLGATARLHILRELLQRRHQISIAEYLQALGNLISRQQALIDLKSCSEAKLVGQGRGARWQWVA